MALTPDQRLYARHFGGSVSGSTVILALRYFRRQVGAAAQKIDAQRAVE